ncbi:MAG: nitroreductase family protein [Desulfobacterales bacterium]|nr:nitroreductase family protein [Desulfobacterales bacterium]
MKTIDELINQRRSIRKYKPDIPPNAWITEMIQSALMAPSPSNSQPVRFIRINSKAVKDRLHRAMTQGYNDLLEVIKTHDKMKKLRNRINYFRRFSEFLFNAPVLFAIGTSLDVPGFSNILFDAGVLKKDVRGHVDFDITTGLALNGFILKAESFGLGTCILSAPMVFLQDVESILGLDHDIRINCFVTLGYADETPSPKKRKKVPEVYQEI